MPEEGTFTDFISEDNDIVVGPPGGADPDTASQAFDPTLLTGIGSFSVSPSATLTAEDVGQIVLTYDVYDADPNTTAGANQLFSDLVLAADASVTVGGSAVPEPGTFFPAAGAFLGFAVWRISARRGSRRGKDCARGKWIRQARNYKPVFVPLRAIAIRLGRTLLHGSSLGRFRAKTSATYPEVVTERAAPPPLFGLAPRGVCPASRITPAAVRFYRTISPLPDGLLTDYPAVYFLWHFP